MERDESWQVKIYQRLPLKKGTNKEQKEEFLLKFEVFLEDKPGSLADISRIIAKAKGNIGFFHYDRSIDCNTIALTIYFENKDNLEGLLHLLEKRNYHLPKNEIVEDEIQIITPESVLEAKVRLVNKPGSLATFAEVLKKNQANVIYMFYDEDIDSESVDIALATKNPEEINTLLDVINHRGYSYKVIYRGSEIEKVEHIIGLKAVERFFLRLQKLVSPQETQKLTAIIDSSKSLYNELVHFYSEIGNHLEKADVFENVLTFAFTSLAKNGEKFYAKELAPLQFDFKTKLFSFRLPTGGNIFIFDHDNEVTMFDAGYGVYYEDIKNLLKKKGIDPAQVKRIFISHPDADHVGTSGYFSEEFGTRVFMHQNCQNVIKSENRAEGVNTKLLKINKHFTVLVNKFTRCKYPKKINFFSTTVTDRIGAFNVIDTFLVGSLKFEVLESKGGHVPGQVFFMNKEKGLLFTSDYLINVESLVNEEKNYLRLPKFLMTSTNIDSRVFRKETKQLIDIISRWQESLKKQGKFV